MAADQRRRLIGAAGQLVAEHGVTGTSARAIASRAGVSSSSFYARFEGVDDLLAASFAGAKESLLDQVASACDEESEIEAKIGAAVEAALSFVAGQPSVARLLGLELVVAVPAVAREGQELSLRLGELLGMVRELGDEGLAPGIRIALVEAALALAGEVLGKGRPDDLRSRSGELARLLAQRPEAAVDRRES